MRIGFKRGVEPVGAADDKRGRRCLARPRRHARGQLACGELIAALIKHDGQRLSRNLRADAIGLGGEHGLNTAVGSALFRLDFDQLKRPVGSESFAVFLHAIGNPGGLVAAERDELKFHNTRPRSAHGSGYLPFALAAGRLIGFILAAGAFTAGAFAAGAFAAGTLAAGFVAGFAAGFLAAAVFEVGAFAAGFLAAAVLVAGAFVTGFVTALVSTSSATGSTFAMRFVAALAAGFFTAGALTAGASTTTAAAAAAGAAGFTRFIAVGAVHSSSRLYSARVVGA